MIYDEEIRMTTLEIFIEEKTMDSDKVAFIKLKGDLDARTAFELENKLENLFKEKEIYKWVLDFSELSYIASAGFGTLLVNFGRVKKKGGFIKLTNLSGNVREIFKFAGLLNAFEIIDDINPKT